MRVSSVNQGLPFKAQVNSASPLVSGDWAFLEVPDAKKDVTPEKKESHWFRNSIITIAALALIGYGLIKGRNSEAIDKVMKSGYENLTSFGEKFKYGIGKLGDYAKTAYDCTIGKLVSRFASKAS